MANQVKIERQQARIIEALNECLLREVSDAVAKKATLTSCHLSHDKTSAKIYVDSIFRNETLNVVKRLNELKGLFRSYLAKNFSTRTVPTLNFVQDVSLDNAKKVEAILEKLDLK